MTKLPIIGYPNFDKIELSKLSKNEAKLYFKEFIELIPKRVQIFSDLIKEEIPNNVWSIDKPTEENLKFLFNWLIKNISYENKDGTVQKILPPILDNNVWDSEFDYTFETKSKMTYIATIWGEMFKNCDTDCDWELNDKNKNDFNFNMPILVGKTKAELCPFSILEVVCAKVMNESLDDSEEFLLAHSYWLGYY